MARRRARVCKALTTPAQFSQWFQHLREFWLIEGAPIHMDFGEWDVHYGRVEAAEPMDRVAYRWTHEGKNWDAAIPIDEGAGLTVIEPGFASLPEEIRERTLLDNTQGREEQMGNIQAYLASAT